MFSLLFRISDRKCPKKGSQVRRNFDFSIKLLITPKLLLLGTFNFVFGIKWHNKPLEVILATYFQPNVWVRLCIRKIEPGGHHDHLLRFFGQNFGCGYAIISHRPSIFTFYNTDLVHLTSFWNSTHGGR